MREELKIELNSEYIHCYLWKNEYVLPKAVIVISHGMAEHAKRYDELAQYLVDNGFVVFAGDHFGHGKTAKSISDIGKLNTNNFIQKIIQDIKAVFNKAHSMYDKLPIYLFAHSMGSIASQGYIEQYPNDFEKVILSGTAIGSLKYSLLKQLSYISMKFHGQLYYSNLIENLTMGGFNKKFKDERPTLGWLSINQENIENYIHDEYCGARFPVNYYYSIGKSLNEFKKNSNIKKIAAKSILMISGDGDPVSSFGKDIVKLSKKYQRNNLTCRYQIIENARHETFNENVNVKKYVFNLIKEFYES